MLRERAGYHYQAGRNCAEAMLLAMNEVYGLGLASESLRLVSGFGGGMGAEKACGALTGAVAALGEMLHEQRESDKAAFGQACAGWVSAFERDLGAIDCMPLKALYRQDDSGCLNTVERAADSFERFWASRA